MIDQRQRGNRILVENENDKKKSVKMLKLG
jgi:hypothetical protein